MNENKSIVWRFAMLLFSHFSIIELLVFIVALLLAFTIHEFSHAYVAYLYGDPTAKDHGRLTLNPLAHLDPIGTLLLLLVGFGWGKPVPVNPNNFENPKLDNLTVSLAGPMSNLILAVIFGLILRFTNFSALPYSIFEVIITLNLILMIFNLIPIPPLDGSKILALFLNEETFLYLQQIGVTILFVVIIFSSLFYPILPTFLTHVVNFFFTLITGKPPLPI